MKNIVSLDPLYKRDSTGRIRIWTVEYGCDTIDGPAGVRTIAGLVSGQKVTSIWNMKEPKNTGKKNDTTAWEQAASEAQSAWDRRIEKEFFKNIKDVDSYEKFKPMLAADYASNKVSKGYSQPKLDGIRCIADENGLWTRAGKEITSCPHIWKSVKPFIDANPGMILDGELYNHALKADFNKITSLVRKLKSTQEDFDEAEKIVQYHVYDCYIGELYSETNFIDRIKVAKGAKSDVVHIVKTEYVDNQIELDALYDDYVERGYEGQIIRLNTPYENKRTKNLLKRKEFVTEEFEVAEILEGLGNWSGYVKRFVLKIPHTDTKTFGAGIKGTQEQMKQLWESGKTPDWATVRYFNLTPDGVPRFPVVVDYGYGTRVD